MRAMARDGKKAIAYIFFDIVYCSIALRDNFDGYFSASTWGWIPLFHRSY